MSEKAEDSSHNRVIEEVSVSEHVVASISGCNISTDQFATNTTLAHCEIRSSGSLISPAFSRDTGNLVGLGSSTNSSIQDERLATSRTYPYVPDQWRASSEHSTFHSTNSHQQDSTPELEWTSALELFAKNQQMSEKAEDSSHNQITEEVSTWEHGLASTSGSNVSTDQFTINTTLAHCKIRSSGSLISPAFSRDTGNLVGLGSSTNSSIQDERLATSCSYPYVPDQWRASSEHSMLHSTNSHQQDSTSEWEWTRELELFAKNQHRQPRLQFLSQVDKNINSFPRSLSVPVSTVQLTTNTTLAHSEIQSSSFATSPASPRNIEHLIGVEPSTNTSTQDERFVVRDQCRASSELPMMHSSNSQLNFTSVTSPVFPRDIGDSIGIGGPSTNISAQNERSASTRSYFHIPDHRRDSSEHSMLPSTNSQQSSTSESEWNRGLELFDANQYRQPTPRLQFLPSSATPSSNSGSMIQLPTSSYHSPTADERPHKCRVCGKGFEIPCKLKRHEITHTAERPFHCHICGYSFKRSDILIRHVKWVHTLENPC